MQQGNGDCGRCKGGLRSSGAQAAIPGLEQRSAISSPAGLDQAALS